MTRASNEKSSAASLSPSRGGGGGGETVVLALHDNADGTALVILRADAFGAPAVVAANQLTAAELSAALAAAVKRHRPSRIVRVAPSAWCVARAEPAPTGIADRRELAQALALLAEGELPGSAPAHRRAAAPFALADSAPEAAILAAWIAGPATPPAALARGESWCPEPIALAAIAALASSAPAALVARADRAGGAAKCATRGNRPGAARRGGARGRSRRRSARRPGPARSGPASARRRCRRR